MINNKKGKEHMPRPLKVRIIAFLTALAMAFSVIYFNNRSRSVEATTPTVTDVVDNSYLMGIANLTAEDITVYAPASGITFSAPSDNNALTSSNVTLYTNDNTHYYIDGTALSGDVTSIDTLGYFTIIWRSTTDGTGSHPTTITTGDTIYRYNIFEDSYYYETEDRSIIPEDAASYTTQKKKSIVIDTYDPAGLTFNATSNPASVSDISITETEDTKYYGEVSYKVKKDSEAEQSYDSLDAVNAAINALDADGSYTITKVINAPTTGGSKQLFTEEKTGDINNHFLQSYEAVVDGTPITGDMSDPSNYKLTIPASGTLSAVKPITINFTTDSALDTKTITQTGMGAGHTEITSSGNSHTFTIKPVSTVVHDETVSYAVEIGDGNGITETINIEVNYSNGRPSFSSEKVDSDDVVDSSTTILKNTDTVEYNATLNIEDPASSLLKLGTVNSKNAVISGASSGDYSSISVDSFTPGSTVKGDVTLYPGYNYLALVAETGYEGASTTYEYPSKVAKVFYDDTNPYVDGDLGLSQDSAPVTVTKDTDTEYSATVSAMKPTDFSFKVGDLQKDREGNPIDGSGIDSVTVNGTSVTPATDGTCTYQLPANSSKAGGGSDSIDIDILDKAGNSSTYTVTLNYLNEKADISESFNVGFVDGSNYAKWAQPTDKTVTVTYTINTKFELAATDGVKIVVDGNQESVTVPAPVPTEDGYKYTVSYTYPDTASKAGYVVTLTTKNINGCETTHDTKVVSIDLDNPVISFTDKDGNPVDPNQWYNDLVLKVTVDDGTVSSGLDHVDATGVDKATYTESPFYATVNKSTTPAGTAVSFKAYDKSGRESDTVSGMLKVDQDKPRLTLKVGGKDYTEVDGKVISVADPVINYTAVDDLSGLTGGYTFKIDGNTYPAPISQDKKLSEILGSVDPAHAYKIELSATDHVGNSETYTTTFKADGAKPEIDGKIETQPKKAKYPTCFNENVKLTVNITDANLQRKNIVITDTEGHTLKTDVKEVTPGKWVATINASSGGKYNVRVKATDDGGLTNTWDKPFIIDKAAPDVTTQLNGSTYTASNSYNTTVTTGVVVKDENEDEADVVVTMEREKPEGGSETISKTGKGPFTVSDDGFYKVTYVVTDKAGNKTTKEIGFTVDNTAPVNNLYVLTDNPSKVDSYHNNYVNVHNVFTEHSNQENYAYGQYYNTDVTVELNYFDYNLNSVYVTDRGTELSPTWTEKNGYGKATITLSSEGYHEIKIWTDDLSGNSADDTEVGQKIRFTIDKTSPVISTTLNGAGYAEGSGVRYLTTNGTVGVTVSDTNVDEKDLKRIYRITPPGGATRTGEDYVSPGSETYQEEADYQVQYVAVDKAGNSSSVRTVEFRVDKTAPQLSISSVGATSTAGSVSISFNVKEAFYWDMNSVTIKIYKKKDGSGETLEKTIDMKPKSSNDSTSYTFTEDAEYRIEFTAEDKCGNKATTDYTFIKDGTAPRIVLSGVGNYDKTDKNVELMLTIDEDFYTSNKVTLKGTRTDIDGKKNEITFDDFAPNRSKVSELKQLFDKDGIYDIEVTSVDKAGNKSTKNVHFTIDKTPPKIGDLSKYDKKMLREFKWDIDLNKLVTDLTVCEITLYLDGVEYDGVSPIEDGSHVLKVEAVDEMGHKSSKEVTFVLDSKGPNIIVSNVEDQDVFYEAKDIGVSVQLDEDMLDEVQLNGSAVTVTDNQATMKIDKKGDYTLTAKAHDEAGNESSISIKFTFGSEMNFWMIIGIAGGIILLLLILLLIIRKKRSW
ncbi:MAG: Ig-like domain repeat protein [Eubacterium sp.]|nr:Ig-like domain repeat protein [Eubacterium sp.]